MAVAGLVEHPPEGSIGRDGGQAIGAARNAVCNVPSNQVAVPLASGGSGSG